MNLSNENVFLSLGIALLIAFLALNVGNSLYNFEKLETK
jgi:hypothetical protein